MSYRYIIAFSVIIGFCVILDVYTWKGLKKTLPKRVFSFFKWFIPVSTFLFFMGFIINIYRGGQGIHNANYLLNIITGFSFGVFLAKLLIASPFIIEDVVRYLIFIFRKIKSRKYKKGVPGRRKFVRNIALSLALIPLSGTIYAITRGKYNYQIKRERLHFKRLPKSFEGLRIVQFTDFHAGSFDDPKAVEQGLQLINEQDPDIVLFTGDLVNNRAVEVEPFMHFLSGIRAKVGKYSILGNHDYGDYMPFDDENGREKNLKELYAYHEKAGFTLLRNESLKLKTDEDEIIIGGVENWGNAPFPQYGDLDKTFAETDEHQFKILMSHDPDHWDAKIRNFKTPIDFTLSGHTHGAQFGISIPGWKWSPVKYRYKRWLGKYEEGDSTLYVSKGFGFLGFPGRIGMSPEIVVFDLYCK
jgi:predicted MPP superfamily phosphohydrolase